MNISLDTSVLYTDPFTTNREIAILINLAKVKKINLFIPEIVCFEPAKNTNEIDFVMNMTTKETVIDGPVFCGLHGKGALRPGSVGRRFTDLLKKYNMKREELSAHSIRHATASQLLDNGAGIRHVQELLGHRNLETTARYTHVEGERLGKIYRKYHPQEHDLFDAVDGEYKQRLEMALGITGVT